MTGPIARLDEFALRPASPLPLAVLRVGLAAALLVQAAQISGALFDLYGSSGIMQGALSRMLNGPSLPGIAAVSRALTAWHVPERITIVTLAVGYVLSLVAMLVGYRTRIVTASVWALHVILVNGHMALYGVDVFTHVFLFYLLWMPTAGALSLDAYVGRVSTEPSAAARLSLRVLQIHLCFVYLSSGIEKALGPQWWNGEAMWRALMLPEYRHFDFGWLASVPWVAQALCLGTLAVEIGYALFMWGRRTRRPWILATVAMHLGIAVFLGLSMFGGVMALFTLTVFGVSGEPSVPFAVEPALDVP